jgi:hypothetical protein
MSKENTLVLTKCFHYRKQFEFCHSVSRLRIGEFSGIRGKFRPKSSARFLARTACLCVGTSFFAHKIDQRHDDLTASADHKSLDLPSPRVGI